MQGRKDLVGDILCVALQLFNRSVPHLSKLCHQPPACSHPSQPPRPGYSVKYKMALFSSLVVAGLMSGAMLVQSRSMPSLVRDPAGRDGYNSGLPSLPSYDLEPDIANNVRQGHPYSLSSTN
jgi:hypothetical protein